MDNVVRLSDFKKRKQARIMAMSWLQRFFERTAGISKCSVEKHLDNQSRRFA